MIILGKKCNIWHIYLHDLLSPAQCSQCFCSKTLLPVWMGKKWSKPYSNSEVSLAREWSTALFLSFLMISIWKEEEAEESEDRKGGTPILKVAASDTYARLLHSSPVRIFLQILISYLSHLCYFVSEGWLKTGDTERELPVTGSCRRAGLWVSYHKDLEGLRCPNLRVVWKLDCSNFHWTKWQFYTIPGGGPFMRSLWKGEASGNRISFILFALQLELHVRIQTKKGLKTTKLLNFASPNLQVKFCKSG